ncbi:DUF3263 domain-containing protein [Micrococcus terreus]|uniref:DUF3263 domain-containing protein n=1 Tax=Micrococcus terreus TaxID=574650 RepID=UPI003D731EFB
MLTDTDRAILELAGRTYRHRGAQIDAVTRELGITYTAYTMRLRDLLTVQAAWEHDPMLMRRLAGQLTTHHRATRPTT